MKFTRKIIMCGSAIALSLALNACGSDDDVEQEVLVINQAPTLTVTAAGLDLSTNPLVPSGGQIDFDVTATDPENDTLTFEALQTSGPDLGADGPFQSTDELLLDLPSVTEDSVVTIDISVSDGTNTTTETVMFTIEANPQGACPSVGNLTITEAAAGQCNVTGVLTESASLTADMMWFLEDRLQIGNNASSVVLTVDAGTQIRGSGTDHILVWPGSAISSNGTAEAPVQMLSDDANTGGSGEWGGLFLRGFNGLPTLTGTQGANNLDFTVVAEAGAPVSVTIDGQTANYQDNIVINGVDSTTTLAFVQSHYSNRDGFRILNSDARMAWLLATASGSDGVWYNNFTGLIKDLLVIHNPDQGRAGIYSGESITGDSNPRIVNATLVGRDTTSDVAGATDRTFGILFADNTDQIRMANVAVVNFANGCFETEDGADLSAIDTSTPGPNYLDGVHCLNEAGGNGQFGIVRAGSTGFPAGTLAANNSNGEGHVYYNGAVNPANFAGEANDLTASFTASWYLASIGGFNNGILDNPANPPNLNAFLDGDTNTDGIVDALDRGSSFIIGDNAFNADVQANTGGYDLTIIGSVRGGNPATNSQFDGWTVGTGADDGFVVQPTSN